MNRKQALIDIAEDTIHIIERGFYSVDGKLISIRKQVENTVERTILYTPKDTLQIMNQLNNYEEHHTSIEVTNETTLSAAFRMTQDCDSKVIALNFASAKNPGGGFLNGSSAQEESLARVSGLYPSLISKNEMYNYNRNLKTCLYSDYMIYSPDTLVFKDEKGELLENPYFVSFITSPAVNAGIVRSREAMAAKNQIHFVMKKRIEKILALALHNGYKEIVLGAFGCGVFKNNPKDVARYFNEAINQNRLFKNKFKKIVFAVWDTSTGKQTFNAFRETFK